MKRKLAAGVVVLLGLALLSGCSFNLAKYNPLARKNNGASPTVQDSSQTRPATWEQVAAEITAMTDRMVERINLGDWQSAIEVGEQAYLLTKKPVFNGKVPEQVYAGNTVKEKLYETLVEAYDFKNHLGGLTAAEKAKYIRTARDHYSINPTDPFKKHALARILIETGDLAEGMRMAGEVYNSANRNKDITDTYAWGLYLAGRRKEAYDIYKTFYTQAETLIQLYHSAVVIEEQDKALGLAQYRNCELAGNNLMVKEENVRNMSAQSYINKIIQDSRKAADRLLAGGTGIDSQYRTDTSAGIVQSIVKL